MPSLRQPLAALCICSMDHLSTASRQDSSCTWDAGLLTRQERGRPAFAGLKKGLRLIQQGIDNHEPTDLAYTFNGYAPISLRLVGTLPDVLQT